MTEISSVTPIASFRLARKLEINLESISLKIKKEDSFYLRLNRPCIFVNLARPQLRNRHFPADMDKALLAQVDRNGESF